MRKGKLMLALALALAMCVCQSATAAPEPGAEWEVPGVYTLFGLEMMGYLIDSEAADTHSVLTLDSGGTGRMTMEEEEEELPAWSEESGKLVLTASDGSALEGTVGNGVVVLDFGSGNYLYYAQDGADLSGYELLDQEQFMERYAADQEASASRVWKLAQTLKGMDRIHLNYDLHTDYLDSTARLDVHFADGVFYSLRTSEVYGRTVESATFFQDGKAYALSPTQKTGQLATEVSSSTLAEKAILMDGLYSAIYLAAQQTEFSEETREMDGVSYTVEFFPPQNPYQSPRAFYFDDAGRLAYYLENQAEAISIELGDSLYTVYAMDDAVDDSLFDISGYQIQG